MTDKEAIYILETTLAPLFTFLHSDYKTALKKAIKALRKTQEPNERRAQ